MIEYENDKSDEHFTYNALDDNQGYIDDKKMVYPSQGTYEPDPTMMQLYNQNAKNVNKSVLSSKSAKINFESNLGKSTKNKSSISTAKRITSTIKSGGGSSYQNSDMSSNRIINSTVKVANEKDNAERFKSLASYNSVFQQQH